jgi:hypothetical protein
MKRFSFFLASLLILSILLCGVACTAPESTSSQTESESVSESESPSETESESVSETESESESLGPVEEPGTVIYFGTPTIDGVCDTLYNNSFCYEELPMENLFYAPMGNEAAEEYMGNTAGNAFYLYDEEYLYVCAVIYDETICSRGEEWRMQTEWPWSDDGAEIYIWFSDEDCLAVHGDAAGIRAVVDEHIWGDNHSSAGTYRDLDSASFAATVDEENNLYCVEMRIPLPEYVGTGSMIGTLLEIDDRWALDNEKMIGALVQFPRFPGAENFWVKLGETRA